MCTCVLPLTRKPGPNSHPILSETGLTIDNSTTPWLAGLRLDAFPGPTLSEQVAQAAHHIGANVLSPSAASFETPAPDPAMEGYATFTTREMIEEAHKLGLLVKPWTVSRDTTLLSDTNADAIRAGESDEHRRAAVGVEGGRYHHRLCVPHWHHTRNAEAHSPDGADPNVVRRLVQQWGLPVAPKYPKQRVLACLQEHLERQRVSS